MFAYVAVVLLSLGPWITIVRGAGNVGCLFSEEVCDESEFCFNDLLFGECKSDSSDAGDSRRHTDIPVPLQKLLEEELKRLWVGGYRWPHQYTQCVVQNLLYAEMHRLSYDPGLCVRILKMTVPTVTKEILEALEKISPEDLALIKFKPNKQEERSDFADEVFYPNSKTESDDHAASQRRLKSTSTLLALPGGRVIEMEPEEAKRSASTLSVDRHRVQPIHSFSHRHSTPDRDLTENEGSERHRQSPLLRSLLASLEHLGKGKNGWGDYIDQSEDDDDDSDRYPAPVLPIIKTDLSSDMNQRAAYTEGGMQWVPVDDDDDDKDDSFEIDNDDDDTVSDDQRGHFRATTKSKGNDARRDTNEMEDVFEKQNFDEDTDEESNYGDGSTDLWRPYVDAPKISIREDPDMTPFSRPMRYDTKKPGPNFFPNRLHIDGEESDEKEENENQSDAALMNLLKTAQHEQESDQWKGFRKTSLDGATNIENGKHFNSALADLTDEEKALQDLVSVESSARPDAVTNISRNKPYIKIRGQKELPPRIPDEEVLGLPKREYFRPVSVNLPQSKEESPAANLVIDENKNYEVVDSTHTYLRIAEKSMNFNSAEKLVKSLERFLKLPTGTFSNIRTGDAQVLFKVNPNPQSLNASVVAERAEDLTNALKKATGLTVISAGIGDKTQFEVIRKDNSDHKLFILTFVLCGCLVGVLIAVSVVYVVRHHARSKQKLQSIAQPETDSSQDYQDLCRQRMQRKNNEKPEPIHVVQQPKRVSSLSQSEASQPSPSSRSSTSSWSEEPVTSNMDISTGHMILSYMEDHLKNKDRLEREWEALCAYEAEPCSTSVALLPQNQNKNRYSDVMPYDHSRVILNDLTNVSGSDYINASTITDHDPRNPAYIATQGPLPQTAADFWQMIWEQGSVVIVTLSRLMENGFAMCHRYWPEEGSEVYHIYEVHLVSEHIWCDDYLVRSFYLKNLKTSETRTVTQFHFLSWPENGVPASTKALLEFRRKVNKSYRGRSCPIVVHCSDGSGRTGTYCLIDMVLNRMAKGAKEIDIAATLEHIRDQRSDMVKTKAQFEFVLMAIAEEVHAILKALSQ